MDDLHSLLSLNASLLLWRLVIHANCCSPVPIREQLLQCRRLPQLPEHVGCLLTWQITLCLFNRYFDYFIAFLLAFIAPTVTSKQCNSIQSPTSKISSHLSSLSPPCVCFVSRSSALLSFTEAQTQRRLCSSMNTITGFAYPVLSLRHLHWGTQIMFHI